MVFFAALELDLARPLATRLIALAPSQLLLKNRGRRNADLVAPAGRQFLQRDALFQGLDAFDIGDLLGTDLGGDSCAAEGLALLIPGACRTSVVHFWSLGLSKKEELARRDGGCFLGRIRAGWWDSRCVWARSLHAPRPRRARWCRCGEEHLQMRRVDDANTAPRGGKTTRPVSASCRRACSASEASWASQGWRVIGDRRWHGCYGPSSLDMARAASTMSDSSLANAGRSGRAGFISGGGVCVSVRSLWCSGRRRPGRRLSSAPIPSPSCCDRGRAPARSMARPPAGALARRRP